MISNLIPKKKKRNHCSAYYRDLQAIRDMFSFEMTTDEALQKAYEIVEQYWWPPEEQDVTDLPRMLTKKLILITKHKLPWILINQFRLFE